ncbi:hypothetical protein FOZ63_009696 [Perkinsus olseni]|uniref:Uncharacterized protein n=1 Tax=Perkinsus olseni TaxID=32597 RepID=A0A7J6UMC8_PEROL|nr:hypothetical protein FOZ63_009696 [Perkinsus olseni]
MCLIGGSSTTPNIRPTNSSLDERELRRDSNRWSGCWRAQWHLRWSGVMFFVTIAVAYIAYQLNEKRQAKLEKFFAEREHEFLLPVHREAIYLQEEALQASAIRARRRALGLPDRATGSCEIRDDEPLEDLDDEEE